jgi:hypothetical protein
MSLVEQKKITLLEYQKPHYDKLKEIMSRSHGCIDSSTTGAGKTYNMMKWAQESGYYLIVIAPKTAASVWKPLMHEYGVIGEVYSYAAIRGRTNCTISHPYLHRHDWVTESDEKKTVFTPTERYVEIVDQGIMLILDEAQNVKNANSAQNKSIRALTSSILESKSGRSRFAFLSATLFDKEEHAIGILRAMSFIRKDRLSYNNPATGMIETPGITELKEICNILNPEKTQLVFDDFPVIGKGSTKKICYRLFVDVIKEEMSSSMVPPETGFDHIVKNGYYTLPDLWADMLKKGISKLSRATGWDGKNIDSKNLNFGGITIALKMIEMAKVHIFVRMATEQLVEDINCKVLIYLSYNSSIDLVKKLMVQYEPMMLQGKTKEEDRTRAIQDFMYNPSKRLIISNIKVGKEAISCHDVLGGSKRYTFACPNYSPIDMHQASGRTDRQGKQSDSYVNFVYGEVGATETGILNSLMKKSQVIRSTMLEQTSERITLPGDYDIYHEDISVEGKSDHIDLFEDPAEYYPELRDEGLEISNMPNRIR